MSDRLRARAEAFCTRFNLRLPILLGPMAGACPASLSIAVVCTVAISCRPSALRTMSSPVESGA